MPDSDLSPPPLGANIRRARLAADVKAAALARRLGISRTAVHNWERGEDVPGEERLQQIAEALGTTAAALRYGPDLSVAEDGGRASGREQSVVQRTGLPPDVERAARRLVDAFKREAALAGCTPEELHYIESVLMSPNLPPTLAGGGVAPERLLEHIQAMMEPLRIFFRDAGRKF